jgi:hypothetical protein
MADVESEDNINRTQRRYVVANDTITGQYVGEIPGQALYVDKDGEIDTISRKDVKEWSLIFSHSELNAPMLDKITERREDGMLGESKKGIIVFQNYNTENNVLRLMLEDGGFETIRIRDIDKLEKINNERYIPQAQLIQDDDSCMINGKKHKFLHGVCPDYLNIKQLSKFGLDCSLNEDIIIDITIVGKISDYNNLKILPLSYAGKTKKRNAPIRVMQENINYENRYDEYAGISYVGFRIKIKEGDGNGFVIIDTEKKKYLPIQF